jgi:hypothetical protein
MTIFQFKKPKIVLTAFTDDPTLAEMWPVGPANKQFPHYYQTLEARYQKLDKLDSTLPDNIIEKQSTIRGCYGINNFNNEGFILPLWGEYSIIINGPRVHVTGAADNRCQYHESQMAAGSLDPYHIIKLESPWEFQCNRDIKFMMMQNFFAFNSDMFAVTPGITDFQNQSTTNVFLLVNKIQSDKEIVLKGGTPLAKFFPMTDEDVELKIEIVEDVKKVKIKPFKYFFANGLTKMMRAKKVQKESKGKCPFHFGK